MKKLTKADRAERALEREEDKVIDALYREHCAGKHISVLRIQDLFKMARAMLRAGTARSEIGEAMAAFVRRYEGGRYAGGPTEEERKRAVDRYCRHFDMQNEIVVDDDALVSRADDGVWVQAWLWLQNEEDADA